MGRNARQDAINRLREQQRGQGRFGADLFDERFDRHFDKAFERPARTFFKMGLLVIVLNLLFWGAIIAGILFGLNYYGVI